MREKFLKRIKPLCILPAVLMMCLIFSFSGQNGEKSSGLSERVARDVLSVTERAFDREWSEKTKEDYVERMQFPIRKAAHMTEYFILACFICLPLYVYGVRGKRMVIAAVLLCAAFAASDEFHQSFVGGRTPAVRDVCIDTAGALLGAGAARLICAAGRKKRAQKSCVCKEGCGAQP